MTDLAKLRALPRADLRTLALCAAVSPAIALAIRLAGFRRARAAVARLSARRTGTRPPLATPAAAERARTLSRLVGIAAARSPVRAECLPRALLLWGMLRREGFDAALRIGVIRSGDRLAAHAWVEHEGEPLGSDGGRAGLYAPFAGDLGALSERVS